jgi:hypothetical protein
MNLTLSGDKRDDDPEKSIEEYTRLSGKGDSRGWRFNRDEIHSRQDAGSSEDMQDRRTIDGVRISPFVD